MYIIYNNASKLVFYDYSVIQKDHMFQPLTRVDLTPTVRRPILRSPLPLAGDTALRSASFSHMHNEGLLCAFCNTIPLQECGEEAGASKRELRISDQSVLSHEDCRVMRMLFDIIYSVNIFL